MGVWASQGEGIFDIISTIQHFQNEGSADKGPASDQTIEDIFRTLEENGAGNSMRRAMRDDIRRALSEFEANILLRQLRTNQTFTRKIVDEVIPSVMNTRSGWLRPTPDDIQVFIAMTMTSLNESLLIGMGDHSIFNVVNVANTIHEHVDNRDLSTDRIHQLLKVVEPFVFGRTPLYSALREASGLFLRSVRTYPDHHKLLFVLSDGEPTDEGDMGRVQAELKDAKVTVVGCYISRSSSVEPRRLYSIAGRDWEDGAKFLFTLSSHISTELITRAIFIKHGWQIDIANNETKLFLQVNHPDNLKDACDLARNAVCCQDTLTDLLASVSLDVYISQKNTSIKAHEQVGGTCYANASAAVLHLAMHRILGRDGGYPVFENLRDDMITRHGSEGANTFRVLKEVCPLYRLHFRQVDINGAMKAVAAKRPVVAKFRLTDDEWDVFGSFFRNNPTGILTKRDLDISKRSSASRTGGHAVVLTSFNSKCLRFMNSWGDRWADMGFFRIESVDVLGLEFIDVFWTLNDLTQREKDYYRIHGSEVADKLMKSLKALQVATFTCPLCSVASSVTEFNGTLSHALCPNCDQEFSCNDREGNILALSMYLTSLSR
ncbi:uncharacterized protein LOC128556182 [Mercenaria mercenaria]|uniref:uncharacterized protein LOC128556182 n=1 Tax=Mercenaria mercenaria TaxID=6596 RepID=UPI00234FABAB|nr:uncharacterized protein LOC128556182 [Mercenaria mercenaria]XP_053396302.1 uncharacterized protein LOC128556182 [Mercenaria mercenaria]XP_053396303.1 uncharacterized protein LOC128556182 [Mercenaria mercenaria]